NNMTNNINIKKKHNRIHTLLFDLDNTLYPLSCGLTEILTQRISKYMVDKLNVPEDKVDEIRIGYYNKYGLTLNGLIVNHNVDVQEYLREVYGGVEIEGVVPRDEKLGQVLRSIDPSIKKLIFSNADIAHCRRILKALGVEDCFTDVLEYHGMLENTKPHPLSYQLALKMADTTDASGVVFFEDTAVNLEGAKQAGMITVLVGSSSDQSYIDYCIPTIHDLVTLFPEIIVKDSSS
ncbi:hypothetical protein SAMD00019534_008930, partial [Acytostelium subglobosum LB1]|uniref:hypothetical protein n=1 Tax=Acytostelium subglobosum LB1 TaxID=1410327 RepID=UPI000644A016